MVNPKNPRGVNEVLRRQEVLRHTAEHDYEFSSRPERKRKLFRRLARFLTGRSNKQDD
jgi:hypothetical protein